MVDAITSSIEAPILSVLKTSNAFTTAREIGCRLRTINIPVSDYKVTNYLRKMAREGQLEYKRGRWKIIENQLQSKSFPAKIFSPPLFSPELSQLLDESKHIKFDEPKEDRECETLEESISFGESPWETFRKLVRYYRECVRNEEGADATAYLNQAGEQFLYLSKSGSWYPKPRIQWRQSIPLGPHLSSFLPSLNRAGNEQPLVLGYPLDGVYISREGEPDVALIQPIFFFPVERDISTGNLNIRVEDPRPEVNLAWLEYRFKKNPENKRSFLSGCGLINRIHSDDEILPSERGELIPTLDNLIVALTSFFSERVREPLLIDRIPDTPIKEPFQTGIYNRVVLMFAKRTKYTKTLLSELTAIEKATDEELNKTALKHVFLNIEERTSLAEKDQPVHEEVVIDTTLSLNAEQRSAVSSLMNKDVTLITGPPGVGKSQVVSTTIGNSRLKKKTVLLASRNHKAIDAVFERLRNEHERPLVIRANSKNDPNLNYTFGNAIRDLLIEPFMPGRQEHLKNFLSEISALLEERGSKARKSNLIAKISGDLGEKEEQRAFLEKSLTGETRKFLDKSPEVFPFLVTNSVVKVVKEMQLRGAVRGFGRSLRNFILFVKVLPWYFWARYKLSKIPGLSKLPIAFSPGRLASVNEKLSVLEKSSFYSDLRLKIIPLENKLKKLPLHEELTPELLGLSERLNGLAGRAISLDLESRSGLTPDVNREELKGLQAALKDQRTGLADGVIRAETLSILKKYVPKVLEHYPCWAVTSLSVGSRIPLVAGMFDLVVVDEASQSDIPSSIPLLFRAKRAGVVGDPFQLIHSTKLSTAKDTILRQKSGLIRVENARFSYKESSLYDLVASTNRIEPIFLSETYRSANEIADYSNTTFYSGRLRVATNHNNLRIPQGMERGIHWTDIQGEIKSGGGSGSYCSEEVNEVARLVQSILLESRFSGTLGVVTPFRQQANRIRDNLYEGGIPFEILEEKLSIDTAHGFQGDEKDVVLFSLCAGPGMPAGSLGFLRETGNLFNVAVSRARAVLHVVGNRSWASSCGIRHIQNLASTEKSPVADNNRGQWHPHESPWEKIFYDALTAKGINIVPQHPVSSRRLDLAFIRKTTNPIKIDIEVDGDCHRNSDGTRKIDDVWRDVQLIGMGWKVMRFWVYQLREDIDGCVDRILKVVEEK
jgi:very-short-patch-repair endonuclease